MICAGACRSTGEVAGRLSDRRALPPCAGAARRAENIAGVNSPAGRQRSGSLQSPMSRFASDRSKSCLAITASFWVSVRLHRIEMWSGS